MGGKEKVRSLGRGRAIVLTWESVGIVQVD